MPALLAAFAVSASNEPAPRQAVDLARLDYRSSPFFPGVETAVLFGDPGQPGLYTTHARVSAGARIPPHTHPNALTTWVTSGTAYIGTGTEFDETVLQAYPAGTFFITPAGSPHFIYAKEGDVAILDHGAGPSSTRIVGD